MFEEASGRKRRAVRPGGLHVAVSLALAVLGFCAETALAADPFLRRTPVVEAVERVGPAVVSITTEQIVQQRSPFGGRTGDPFFDQFFNNFVTPRRQRAVQNLGSGVIIDSRRHVLTNEHVVSRASRIRVTLNDGREYPAELVGADTNNDLAVLRIEADEKLPFVEPGRSDDLLVGEPVIAIGNPFGLSNTVTSGVISALNRSLRTADRVYHGFMQTDASINPGNSGGPLLNAEGTLIGINTAVYNGAEGIGFAIPIDAAMLVVDELIEHGEIQDVWLGLEYQELAPALREAIGLPGGVSGVLVNQVRASSPAAEAGLERGDILTGIDGRSVSSSRDIGGVFQSLVAGQSLKLQLWRDHTVYETNLVAEPVPDAVYRELSMGLLGLELSVEANAGALVTAMRQNSNSARAGLQPGDHILALGGRALREEGDLRKALLQLRTRSRALLVVQRGNGRYHVTVPIE